MIRRVGWRFEVSERSSRLDREFARIFAPVAIVDLRWSLSQCCALPIRLYRNAYPDGEGHINIFVPTNTDAVLLRNSHSGQTDLQRMQTDSRWRVDASARDEFSLVPRHMRPFERRSHSCNSASFGEGLRPHRNGRPKVSEFGSAGTEVAPQG